MNLRSRPFIVAGVVVLAFAAGGAAFATVQAAGGSDAGSGAVDSGFSSFVGGGTQDDGSRLDGRDRDGFGFDGRDGDGFGGPKERFGAVAGAYLGLSAEEVERRLRNGQSLADIARAEGKSVAGLKDALVDAAREDLAEAAAAGRLSGQERNRILQFIRAHIDDIVEGRFGGPGERFGRGGPGGFDGGPERALDAAAEYLGLSAAQLETRLRSGRSLVDVARERGKPVEGLKRAMLDDAEANLSKDVQEGRLTEQQKNEILGFIRSHIDDLISGRGPRFDGPGDRFGPRDGFGPDGPMGPPDGAFGPPSGAETPPSAGSFA